MRAAATFLALGLAVPALAQPLEVAPPLSAEAFDALTRGKTMDTFDAETGLYGVETFLSGHRSIWRDSERCIAGTWAQVGEQICFTYEDKPQTPVCWRYEDRGDAIFGWFEGNRDTVPILLRPSGDGPVGCEGYIGV